MTPEELSSRIARWKNWRDGEEHEIRLATEQQITRLEGKGLHADARMLRATLAELEPEFRPTLSIDREMGYITAIFTDGGTAIEDIPLHLFLASSRVMHDAKSPYAISAIIRDTDGRVVGVRLYGMAMHWPLSQPDTLPVISPERRMSSEIFMEQHFPDLMGK